MPWTLPCERPLVPKVAALLLSLDRNRPLLQEEGSLVRVALPENSFAVNDELPWRTDFVGRTRESTVGAMKECDACRDS